MITNVNYSQGLEFKINSSNEAVLVGVGTCKDIEIVIPMEYESHNVTKIDRNAFSKARNVRGVVIPKSIVKIGSMALSSRFIKYIIVDKDNNVYDSRENCNALIETKTNTLLCGSVNTTIPSSVKVIRKKAFSACYNLTKMVIPEGVERIESRAFENCRYLESIVIPNTVNYIGDNTFGGCQRLKDIKIPGSVEEIGDKAFMYCDDLTNVLLGNGIKRIGSGAFSYCDKLINIILPDTIVSMGKNAFSYCSSLEQINIPKNIKIIDDRTFIGCRRIRIINIPFSVEVIGVKAFDGCSSIKEIIIPSSVHQINSYAFNECIRLKKIFIPKSVNKVENYAFSGCKKLTIYSDYLTIPDEWDKNYKDYSTDIVLRMNLIGSYKDTPKGFIDGVDKIVHINSDNSKLLFPIETIYTLDSSSDYDTNFMWVLDNHAKNNYADKNHTDLENIPKDICYKNTNGFEETPFYNVFSPTVRPLELNNLEKINNVIETKTDIFKECKLYFKTYDEAKLYLKSFIKGRKFFTTDISEVKVDDKGYYEVNSIYGKALIKKVALDLILNQAYGNNKFTEDDKQMLYKSLIIDEVKITDK